MLQAGAEEIIDEDLWKRSYEIWDHACNRIEHANTSLDLADGISNLKRSLNQRLKLIESLYSLKDIKYKNMPKGYLEVLRDYKIVRPFIMQKLLNIRNNIEHNDANPPELDNCKEWLDVIWYFLKSTDNIVKTKSILTDFIMYDDEKETQYTYEINIENYRYPFCGIRGRFPSCLFSLNKKCGYMKIYIEDLESKEEIQEKNKDIKHHDNKFDTDINVSGKAELDSDTYRFMMEKILSAF